MSAKEAKRGESKGVRSLVARDGSSSSGAAAAAAAAAGAGAGAGAGESKDVRSLVARDYHRSDFSHCRDRVPDFVFEFGQYSLAIPTIIRRSGFNMSATIRQFMARGDAFMYRNAGSGDDYVAPPVHTCSRCHRVIDEQTLLMLLPMLQHIVFGYLEFWENICSSCSQADELAERKTICDGGETCKYHMSEKDIWQEQVAVRKAKMKSPTTAEILAECTSAHKRFCDWIPTVQETLTSQEYKIFLPQLIDRLVGSETIALMEFGIIGEFAGVAMLHTGHRFVYRDFQELVEYLDRARIIHLDLHMEDPECYSDYGDYDEPDPCDCCHKRRCVCDDERERCRRCGSRDCEGECRDD